MPNLAKFRRQEILVKTTDIFYPSCQTSDRLALLDYMGLTGRIGPTGRRSTLDDQQPLLAKNTREPSISKLPEANIRIASGNASHSVTNTRAASFSAVSSSSTGTVC